MPQPPPLLFLDAGPLLNLYATGRIRDIVLAWPSRVGVADYVLEEEALYIWGPGREPAQEDRQPVDLSPLVAEGVIAVYRLETVEERATFVDLAAFMDDGEAVTAALAAHREAAVATDDRKARRAIRERVPDVPLVSTLELLKQWADSLEPPTPDELRTAMLAMQSGATFTPGERDPLYAWWRHRLQGP
ncbi:MAG: hypothetical protein HY681_06015 [Chloroflexi bacterium]|nr:hypothetical protein [Chloroflexota bacterium]